MVHSIKNRHRAAIIEVIADNEKVERAVLFGSRAMRSNTVTSDVDIALFGNALTFKDYARLKEALENIPMAQSVDLVIFKDIDHQPLIEHIKTFGVEWYRREA